MNKISLHRLLGLDAGELPRVVPFFVVYFLLFTALTIADGVAVSLVASGMIAGLAQIGPVAIAVAGLMLGIAFVVSAIGVGKAYDDFKH